MIEPIAPGKWVLKEKQIVDYRLKPGAIGFAKDLMKEELVKEMMTILNSGPHYDVVFVENEDRIAINKEEITMTLFVELRDEE